MRYCFLLLFCLFALQSFAQQSRMDSLRRDSLIRVGYERSQAIRNHRFTSYLRTDSGYVDNRVWHDSIAGYGMKVVGFHTSCCDSESECHYQDGKLIACFYEDHSPLVFENSVTFFFDGYTITAHWKANYTLEELLHSSGTQKASCECWSSFSK